MFFPPEYEHERRERGETPLVLILRRAILLNRRARIRLFLPQY
jgi:hypothetical protein